MDFEKYNKYFYALPGIDYGTATYYIKENKNNIFGKEPISPYMKSNLGEFIIFCKKGAYFVNTIEDTEKYIGKIKGSHSGFSKEELIIPLIVINI